MKGIPILFEDERILVFNKPPGLPVQGGAGVGTSLDSLLARGGGERPLLVHRLDKDTSGIIVTAKTREYAAKCSALFSNRLPGLKKTYLAFCAGILEKEGTINEKLLIKGRERECVTSFSRKECQTLSLPPDKPGECMDVSFAELKPATGRMHQIRRHLAQKGHPILGDDKYGDFVLNKKLKKTWGLKALFLHAYSIYLPSSLVKGGLEITAPLPRHFTDLMNMLGPVH